MNPSVFYITAAALLRVSLNPLVLMDGPVKASQDAGNRITANRILDQEEERKNMQRHEAHEWTQTKGEASNSKKQGTSLIIQCQWLVIDNVALLKVRCN